MAEHDLKAVAFPRLDQSQMAALGSCPLTTLKRYRDGEKLFEAGQRDVSFYVIKSGKVEIVDDSEDPPKTLTALGPGEFTGEVSQLCGSPVPVSAVARGDCEVYEMSPDALRQLLGEGKILSWGVSNFDVPDLEEVRDIGGQGGPVCNQVLYHPQERAIEHAVLPWCEKYGLAVVGYSPFGTATFRARTLGSAACSGKSPTRTTPPPARSH